MKRLSIKLTGKLQAGGRLSNIIMSVKISPSPLYTYPRIQSVNLTNRKIGVLEIHWFVLQDIVRFTVRGVYRGVKKDDW